MGTLRAHELIGKQVSPTESPERSGLFLFQVVPPNCKLEVNFVSWCGFTSIYG